MFLNKKRQLILIEAKFLTGKRLPNVKFSDIRTLKMLQSYRKMSICAKIVERLLMKFSIFLPGLGKLRPRC